MTEDEQAAFLERLRRDIGGASSPPLPARDPVNQPMIRHWSDAMTDFNPVYIDPDFAAKSVHGEIVAPPAMLNAWGMQGLVPPDAAPAQRGVEVYADLDAAGYTSVVATNSEHRYDRYLRLGELVHGSMSVVDVSAEKKTALGIGHFVTTQTEYTTESGDVVGAMTFRILKFKPGTGRMAPKASEGEEAPRPSRPKPGVSRDNRFFWDGIAEGELRIQKCECGALHHPPMVRCPKCGAYDLGYIVASGRGKVYSHVEPVHPKARAFDYPLVVGLVELEEGTRILSNIVDLDADEVEIGMDVEVVIQESGGVELPVFRPVRPARNETTLRFGDVEVGDRLAPSPIPITPTLIVSTAIASRDYQDVHHDRDLAIKRGSPDIFMNILTSSGLSSRFVTDWAGPEAILKDLKIQLGVPNYPYDTMTMTGEVVEKTAGADRGGVEVRIRGYNRMGNHLTGSISLELPN